ncbi:hypothetical protein EC988_005120 [Linderina pennispora]|nr:hypothetical protein EC988_005120 [Linderina pennispora]
MVATVFESELIRVSQAVSELCASVVGSDHGGCEAESRKQAARDLCVAFVFGLARNVSETFEEVSTLNDAVASLGFGGADSAVTLYSPAIYAPLTRYMGRPAST